MTPTLFTSCNALPPEGAVPPWGGPAAELAPTLATSRNALPPEGVGLAWGGPALRPLVPTLVALGAATSAGLTSTRASSAPALSFPPELLLLAQGVKVAFFDVDGVLTDGGIYLSEHGEDLKRFNTLDGHGLKLLQKAGITPVVITGRDSPALRARLQALGITHAHFGTEDKRPAAEITLQALGLDWSRAAAMGDDWPDLPVMRRAALSCAPANAHVEVKACAHHLTQAGGGHGAAREFCDLLLLASGRYAELLREYTS
jgi:3-deoxy-D-manno-octulosonate 8-phosphate phosphatase (KDO 8-P phosphatase)